MTRALPQVILADTRGPPSCPASDPCTPFVYTYGTWPTFGVSESVANAFDASLCLKAGDARSFGLPLYSRLIWAIGTAAEKYGVNASVAAWSVGGVYLGPGMEGSTVVQLRSSGIDVQVLDV